MAPAGTRGGARRPRIHGDSPSREVEDHWFEQFDRMGRRSRHLTRELVRDLDAADSDKPLDQVLTGLERLQGLAERQQALRARSRSDDFEDRRARRVERQDSVLGWMVVIAEALVLVEAACLFALVVSGNAELSDLPRLP